MIKTVLRGPYALSALIGAGIVVALVAVGLELEWGNKVRAGAAAKRMEPAKAADAGLLPAFNLPAIDQGFTEAAARPIFVPARRPTPPAPVVQVVSAMRKGQFVLLGTSITKDFGDVALLKEVSSNRTHVVRRGDKINGITVDKVEAHRVVLKEGAESEDVDIKTQGSPKGGLPPGAQTGSIFPPPGLPHPGLPPQQAPAGMVPASGMPFPVSPSSPMPPPLPGGNQPAANPGAQLTPEEILARRRAARSQQTK